MTNEQLYINNTYIPLSKSLNPSITRSIADVREPSKRKATHSKTTNVPDGVEAREVFGQIFDINITNNTFDPTVKPTCRYLAGGEEIINGYCQLTDIIVTDEYKIEYEIVMYDGTARFINEIKGKYLEDLDLSEWDHPFDKDVQAYSWDTQVWNAVSAGYVPFALGKGYVYPLIDYGLSQDSETFRVDHIGCAVYVKEYWDAIFSEAGFSYTSTFLGTDAFKGLIIPSSPETYVLDSDEIDERQFSANTPNFTSTGTTSTGNLNLNSYGSDDTLIFTNELSDTSGIYDHTTGVWTVVDAGFYTINALIDVNVTFSPASQPAEITSEVRGKIKVLLNSSSIDEVPFYITRDSQVATSDWPYSTDTTPTYPDNDYLFESVYPPTLPPPPLSPPQIAPRPFSPPDRYPVSTSSIWLDAGDTIEIAISAGFFKGQEDSWFDDSFGSLVAGNAVLNVSVGAFWNVSENTTLTTGDTLPISKIIPKGIKQEDFIKSIMNMFNLYMDVDPESPKNMIIEPRDDFYGSTIRNLQTKIAHDKGVIQKPMGAMDANRYIYTYKEDKDYWNQKYLSRPEQELYGSRRIDVLNEFVQKDKKTEIIFSPTPIVGLPNNDRVIPTILEYDDLNNPKTVKHNIRILYYGGLKSNLNVWYHKLVIGNLTYSITARDEYPYAGHWDDPFNPTLDINFGLVKEVFYDSNTTAITVTNNNLWNKYHSGLIGEITDPDSKIVEAYVNMSAADYKLWSFQDLYWFNNAYHRLNQIIDYNPNGESLTKCEFLKLKSVTPFSASTYPVDESATPIKGTDAGNLDTYEDAPTTSSSGGKSQLQADGNNYVGKTVQITPDSEDNFVSKGAKQIYIDGDRNHVNEATDIRIINGDDNVIDPGVKHVTLINTNELTVTEEDSYSVIVGGKKQNSWVRESSSSFLVDDKVEGYYLDGSSNDVQARINGSESEFIFKCIDDTNRVYIDFGAYDYDNTGNSSLDLALNDTYRIRWDATDTTYYIIN